MPRAGGYLLDTNIVIALIRNNDLGKYIERTYQLTSGQFAFYLPVVVLGEAHALAAKWGWGLSKRNALSTLLAAFMALDISYEDVIASYANTDLASDAVGIKMGKNDLWIAALARTHDLSLLTCDRDFDHLDSAGLIDRIWVDPSSK